MFFRNASVYLWATHFHIVWCINLKKRLLPGKSVLKKVKCLGGGYSPPRSQLLDKIGTEFKRLPHDLGARNPTVLLGILSDVTGSQKSKMAASNLEIRMSLLVDMIAITF